MIFNQHLDLEGRHALLSASSYHWLNYDDAKLENKFKQQSAALLGTQLHQLAADAIALGLRMPRNKKTINMYINDAIGFKMETEQVIQYTNNCFGTADAISFRKNKLRIHDLKNGSSPASFKQLLLYAAWFCLEYNINPADIYIELRIYQNNNIEILIPDNNEMITVIQKTIYSDKFIDKLKEGE